MRKAVFFLVGPTGSGKTQLSLSLAKRLGAEIISADSMLVYRGMDIGTAKPSPSDRKKIPHHLIDLISPRGHFSVYEHRARALRATEDIHKREKVPLIVGGSGLYVNAIWKGLSPQPGADPKLRKQLSKLAEEKGWGFLYEQLRRVDPERAQGIHPNDRRRIGRALEIAKLSGRKPSESYKERTALEDLGYSVRVFGILRSRRVLYDRINRRVESMFRRGLLQEVKRLRRRGFSTTAREALGYREVLEDLKKGENKVTAELVEKIQSRTRQFAKRQLTWFHRVKEIQWIPWASEEPVAAVCDKITKEITLWQRNKPTS